VTWESVTAVDNAAVNAALAENPAASRAAMEIAPDNTLTLHDLQAGSEDAEISGVWLMPSFRTSNDIQIQLYISGDGKSFRRFNDTPIWTTTSPGAAGISTRDPRLLHHKNKFYICFTTTGFSSGTSFDIIESSDLANWELTARVSMTAISGVQQVWGPKWFVDGDTVRICVACTTSYPDGPYTHYEIHATHAALTAWSSPVAITGLPANTIDGVWYKKPGDANYYFWYKNETTKYIEYATSASITSGYSTTGSGDWAGFGTQREGPSLVRIGDGYWRVYYDAYPGGGIYYSESTDDWATWSTPALISTQQTQSNPGPTLFTSTVATRQIVGAVLQNHIGGSLSQFSVTQGVKTTAPLNPLVVFSDSTSNIGGIGGISASNFRGIAITSNLYNAASGGWTLMNTAKPGWVILMGHDTSSDNFEIYRCPATAGTPSFSAICTTTSAGAMTIASDVASTAGNLRANGIGKTLLVKSGSNALAGTVTLTAGAGTISSTAIDANTVIVLTLKTVSGTVGGQPYVEAITAGASATLAGGGGSNNSTYNWVAVKVN
jgi:hypothetical protein